MLTALLFAWALWPLPSKAYNPQSPPQMEFGEEHGGGEWDTSKERSSRTVVRTGKFPQRNMYGYHPRPAQYGPHTEPVCLPPCQNGGVCMAPNTCHCRKGHFGNFCQFKEKMCPEPPSPSNAGKNCILGPQVYCTYKCMEGFLFPDGSGYMTINCINGQWVSGEMEIKTIASCRAQCVPGCQNGGICVSPNTCQCPENVYGPYCQHKRKPCQAFPVPMNSRRSCNPQSCSITCREGHTFPDGSAIASVSCRDGEWVPSNLSWKTIPDCLASCTPTCQNGGICMSYNVCQCPGEFRGSQCQYSTNQCTSQKLHFNGNYKCKGDDTTFNCTVKCPPGMRFESSPAPEYVCLYSTGVFLPENIPNCVSDSGPGENLLDLIFEGEKAQKSHGTSSYSSHNKATSYAKGRTSYEQVKQPKAGVCFTWGKDHYKTFDGRVLSFKSDCVYTLASNVDNNFHIQTPIVRPGCDPEADINCIQINIYISDKRYQLTTNDFGQPIILHNYKILRVPVQLPGIRAEMGSHSVTVSYQAIGVSLTWNLKDFVEVKVSESQWNKTGGLCGRIDGYAENDLYGAHNSLKEYASLSRVDTLGQICQENIQDEKSCSSSAMQQAAIEFCSKLKNDKRFEACRKILPASDYYEACLWDYCSCEMPNSQECSCDSISMYARECSSLGIKLPSWRDENICPMTCDGGRVYMACGKEVSCGGADVEGGNCEEGCFCPQGTYLHNRTCVSKEQCPCHLRGKSFPPGYKVPKECNICTCINGAWSCTSKECSSRCEIVGDPHYTTFDQRTYDFMGKCSYYLLKTDTYSIEAENVPCDGSISENLGFSQSRVSGMASCTKSVTIKFGDTIIKLKQGKEVTVNGEDLTLPLSLKHAYLRHASSLLVQVELQDGIEVLWDGITRVYINAPANYKGKTQGLCGTFNGNQKDDFLTPEGDIEQDAISFANKWKTRDSCDDKVLPDVHHPCDINVQNKAVAEGLCAHITSKLFDECHIFVDPDKYYENCLYDMCSCTGDISLCLCPILAAYAKECSHQGVPINWRTQVRECGLRCPRGQQFQVCGNSCARSCQDLSREKECSQHCVEGCNCPPGLTLDHRGQCIPVSKCPCLRNGIEYPSGHKEIRNGKEGKQLCMCKNAVWECQNVKPEDLKKYPNNTVEETTCKAEKNQVYTHCEPSEPITCQNMHSSRAQQSEAICYGGCVCKTGYVLDSLSKECVKPDECPCHHGGKSYKDGEKIQEECNTCVCNSGKWTCTDHICPGICTAWGDAHFKSFDGKIYDFQGSCEYILSKGTISDDQAFSIVIEIVPCGSSGVSCSKSVTLSVGSGDNKEEIIFSENSDMQANSNTEKISIRDAGLFTFVDVYELGLVLQWDKGTRVVLRVDPKWKSKLEGLCGNYNDDSNDDFQTPGGGGVSEVSAYLFGDSWKLHTYCPEAKPMQDTCELHPGRKSWATQKCGILKSSVFKLCHSEVPVEPYLQRCIYDACGCDQGGDCECLCTAVSAYAQECNAHGVLIKWRNQHLCPIQCDESCSEYSPCITTCPPETCDNTLVHKTLTQMCSEDTCVEGCKLKPCPLGEIYSNLTNPQCVPMASCKPPCMTIDGKDFFEGDLVEGDNCYSCYCSRGKKVCSGQPCTTEVPTTEGTVSIEMGPICEPGWTNWINKNHPNNITRSDIESLPRIYDFGPLTESSGKGRRKKRSPQCPIDMMVDIKCRTVVGQKTVRDMGENAVCDLNTGLVCSNGCHDYEISVLCHCGSTPATPLETTTYQVPEEKPCDITEPLKANPTNCSLYYQCQETDLGPTWVERHCGPSTWFNPKTMMCDWPQTVASIRPECHLTSVEDGEKKCQDEWSEWINSTHPIDGIGDLETFSEFSKKKIELCKNNGFVKDIECKFYQPVRSKILKRVTLVDYTQSKDRVTCDTETGLKCLNEDQNHGSICQDYAIRVYCACENKETEEEEESGRSLYPTRKCPPGQTWDLCAKDCSQLCHYYEGVDHEGKKCSNGELCIPGCKTIEGMDCPSDHRWRDANTCVREADCTCRSHTGEIVKPGTTIKESECEICQCLDNHYICESSCDQTTHAVEVTEERTRKPPETTGEAIILPSTVTPPKECDRSMFIPLLQNLPDSAFSASSSIQGGSFEPQDSRLSVPVGSWKPSILDQNQYLEIDLGKAEPIYGVSMKGSPEAMEYVNTFYVLYSSDNSTYHYVSFLGMPELFHGPTVTGEPVTKVFSEPVEARFVRINPLTWTNGIAMKVEVYGCKESGSTAYITTTLPSILTTFIPICTDRMSAQMSDKQISVSSASAPISASLVSIYNNGGWSPSTNSPNEWIQFDFMGERTLTGIMTAGGGTEANPAWVTSYAISYSQDGQSWNPILNSDGTKKVFDGNSDNSVAHTNIFEMPIHARYLRLIPLKWHNKIALSLQALGCYEPYPELPTETPPVLTTPETLSECNVCPGAIAPDRCPCSPESWWDGEQCSMRSQCPCYVGFISYPIGSVFDNDQCERCICSLNGVPQCKAKECPPCPEGLKKEMSSTCNCECKPCPENEMLCPSSNVCVNKAVWCDGFMDCPDDELNCATTAPTIDVSPTLRKKTRGRGGVTPPPSEECPRTTCPEGSTIEISNNQTSNVELQNEPAQWSPFGSKSKWGTYFSGAKGARGKYSAKGGKGYGYISKTQANRSKVPKYTAPPKCPEYKCLPTKKKDCPKPECQEGFDLVMSTKNPIGNCESFTCVPKKVVLPDGKCNITGRTFTTFDGTEYKYDICDHIIARDKVQKQWEIKQVKKCSYIGPCLKYLLVTQENHTIQFNPDLSILYDGFNYSIPQMQKIGAQTQDFAVKQVSNTFLIFTSIYDFSVIWDTQGNTKIIVPGSTDGTIDGLCGFFDGKKDNDKMKPDGSLGKTTVEFGDSWGDGTKCETRVCPADLQNKAWKMCKEIREGPLTKCSEVVNLDKLLSQCVESSCNCMENNNDTEACRCQAILDAVTECQSHDPSIDLSQWRVAHECAVQCPDGLVYKECFNRACELSCAEMLVEDVCPQTQECFPACYCPDGKVRDGDKCVTPSECRDCCCDGYGQSGYISFDRSDFIFNGNCTYVLVQTVEGFNGQKFQIFGSNGPCIEDPSETCLHTITIMYKEHTAQLINNLNKNIKVKIDESDINELPLKNDWVDVVEVPGKSVILSLPKIQLDVEFYNKGKGFYLRLPSYLYSEKTEGLCGSCNLNATDDFKMKNGTLTEDVNKFGHSWRVKEMPIFGDEKQCAMPERQVECLPPPPAQDPCLKIMDPELFGKCHAIVDPSPYIANCHMALCKESIETCPFLEAYARQCQVEGICLAWRSTDVCPYRCPTGLNYVPCGTGCTPTCDNYESLRDTPSTCTAVSGDTCICPNNKVLANGTCVEENRCKPCDDEGHYPGDEWNPDPCTTCACSENNVQCKHEACGNTPMCNRGYQSVVIKATEGECCPKSICIPEPTSGPQCPEPQQPQCGYGQVMKLETGSSGCQEFICQCKPIEECEDVSTEATKERPPGMKAIIDNSGCCPKIDIVCKTELCPAPPTCQEFHIPVKKESGECCPEYDCRVPNDKCLYEMQYIEGENGGERTRKQSERSKVLKDVGDVWNDGPCRSCDCKEGTHQASCTTKLCSRPPESENYMYEPKNVMHKCCPIYKRTACKMGGKIYKVGSIWPSPDGDLCKNYTCIIGADGAVSKQEAFQTCNRDCPLGWEYEPPEESSKKCCGECKPVGCVVDGKVYPKDGTWTSEDKCISFQCDIENGQVQVVSSQEQCPNIQDCPLDRIYQDTCCKKCNASVPESQSFCTPEAVPLDDTVNIIKTTSRDTGDCVNMDYIRGFTYCLGTCDSYVKYNKTLGQLESLCTCCQALEYKTISVQLHCDSGATTIKEVRVPSECGCRTCDEGKFSQKQNLKTSYGSQGKGRLSGIKE